MNCVYVYVQRHRGVENQNDVKCVQNVVEVQNYAREFARGRWSSLGLGEEEKWCGTSESKLKDT